MPGSARCCTTPSTMKISTDHLEGSWSSEQDSFLRGHAPNQYLLVLQQNGQNKNTVILPGTNGP